MRIPADGISGFVSEKRAFLISYRIKESVLLFLSWTYPVFLFACFVDYLVLLPPEIKYPLWGCIAAAAGFGWRRFKKLTSLSDEEILYGISRKHPRLGDDLVNASQLERGFGLLAQRGLSEDLSETFIKDALEKTRRIPPDEIPTERMLGRFTSPAIVVLLLTAVFALTAPDIFTGSVPKFTFGSGGAGFSRYVKVVPGDAKVPRGTEVAVSVSGRLQGSPRLYARGRNAPWEKIPLEKNGSVFVSEKIAVVEPVEYYVRWGESNSRKYLLEPSDPPRLGGLKVRFYYPAYASKEPASGTSFGDFALLPGTRVEFTGEANRPLKKAALLFSTGRKVPLDTAGGTKLRGNFVAEAEGECWFELTAVDGTTDPQPARYPIYVQKDSFPSVKILSPGRNLVAAQDTSIDIVFEASDDFGVWAADIVYYKGGDRSSAKTVRMRSFSKPAQEYTGGYYWKIGESGVGPGGVLDYYVSVRDNDTVSGPKESRSETYSVEIFSYEKEHSQIEQSLSSFREDLMGLLADQTKVKNSLEQDLTQAPALTPQRTGEIAAAQKDTRNDADKISEELKKLLSRMETDPLMNYQIYSEHKTMQESLEYLSRNQMKYAEESVKAGDYDTAMRNMDDVISNLEKMNLLAEDVLQYQKMQDLLSAGEKMSELGNKIKEGLSAPDKEKLAMMKEVMDRIDKLADEINEIMKKMPKQLPEEFINQPAVKQLDTGALKDVSDSLKKALEAGDYKKALEEAQRLLDRLSAMLRILQDASSGVGFGGAEKQTSEEAKKEAEELQSIVAEQDNLLAETQEVENLRQEEIAAAQEKILAGLVSLQRRAISEAEGAPGKTPGEYPETRPALHSRIDPVLPPMRNVAGEMESRRIIKAREWLKEAVNGLSAAGSYLDDFTQKTSSTQALLEILGKQSRAAGQAPLFVEVSSSVRFALETEKKILSLMESPPEAAVTPSRKNRSTGLSGRQSGLMNRTLGLDKKVQELSRKTSSITPDISANLRAASKEMGNASANLERAGTKDALSNERKALEYLSKAQGSMQDAMQSLQQMQGQMNKPMAGFIQGKQGGGVAGVRTGHVELPGIDEYVPPKEFREELLKALKEKYPEKYGEIIKKYYRKLTE